VTRLMTAREVGEVLGVSTETVLRWVRAGRLPAFRLTSGQLRFDASEWAEWLERRRSCDESHAERSVVRGLGLAMSLVSEVEE
jgi:excisionase family DNA binding protein